VRSELKPEVVSEPQLLIQKVVNSLKMPINGLGLPCLQVLLAQRSFLLVAMSHHTSGSRNIKPEVAYEVQKMARYATFYLIMGPFKGVPVFARLWPVGLG